MVRPFTDQICINKNSKYSSCLFLIYFSIFLFIGLSSVHSAEKRVLTWKTAKGKTIKGMLLDVDGDRVTIGLHHGKKKRIKRSNLSHEHEAMIEDWLKTNSAPKGFKANKTIIIKTVPEKMLYDIQSFIVKPGERIRLIVANEDEMQHNLVLCKKESNGGKDVADAAIKLGNKGMEAQWLPKHKNLMVATGMINPGTQQTIYFTVPKEKGVYPYICSFPGHAMLMKGKMIVGNIGAIQDLSYKFYEGKGWTKLPDFTKLKANRKGKLKKGRLDLSVAKRKNNYGLVFEGKIEAFDTGKYSFALSSDDGSRLLINDQLMVDNDGLHANKTVKSKVIELKKGHHNIKVLYFDKTGQASLGLSWSGPGFKDQKLSKWNPVSKAKSSRAPLHILVKDEARMYRNFITGMSARGIAVGYPEKINCGFDASTMNLAMMWKGSFMDGGRHWVNRGQGYQAPSGHGLVKLMNTHQFDFLNNDKAAWPNKPSRKAHEINRSPLKFMGYKLDKKRYPTFLYKLNQTLIEDEPRPIDFEETGFRRSFMIKEAEENIYFRAAVGKLEKDGEGYLVDNQYVISIKNAKIILRPYGKIQELLVAVPKGDSQFSVDYLFLEAYTAE